MHSPLRSCQSSIHCRALARSVAFRHKQGWNELFRGGKGKHYERADDRPGRRSPRTGCNSDSVSCGPQVPKLLLQTESVRESANVRLHQQKRHHTCGCAARSKENSQTVKDVVCGMDIDSKEAAGTKRIPGKDLLLLRSWM